MTGFLENIKSPAFVSAELSGDGVLLRGVRNFSIALTFDCGQAFRFLPETSEQGETVYSGVVSGRFLRVSQKQNGDVLFRGVTEKDFREVYMPYFDLLRDYGTIISSISDVHAKEAAELGAGIRILAQEPWETLCSFIISQNNNIPRIRKIVERLSEGFGIECEEGRYAFPEPEKLAASDVETLMTFGTGFRAKYILDAARRVESGDISLSALRKADTETLVSELMRINGVGPKVAACTALFGFARFDAFPVDVWMKRVAEKYYGESFTPALFGEYAGIVQQYLFNYERNVV